MGLKDFEEKTSNKKQHFLKRYPDLRKIVIDTMKEAEESDIPDTIAAQYLVKTEKLLSKKSPHTVRRYFKDIRDGIV